MDSQSAEIQIDKKHSVAFMFRGTGGRNCIFQIVTDGIKGQIFLVDQSGLDQDALILWEESHPIFVSCWLTFT